MKKTIFLIGLLSLLGFAEMKANSQNSKEVIYVDYFTRADIFNPSLLEALRTKIIENMRATDRFVIIDVDSEEGLKVEESRRKQESAMEDEAARNLTMKTRGAHYITKGHAVSINTEKVTNEKGEVSYKGSLSFTLKVTSTSDGQIKASKTFTFASSGSASADQAIMKTVQAVNLTNFIDEYFKIEGDVIQIDGVNKKGDKATSLLINLGKSKGIQVGQQFIVYIEMDIAGELSRKSIGRVSVSEVLGDNRSSCKVTDGAALIKKSSGEKLVVISDRYVQKSLFKF